MIEIYGLKLLIILISIYLFMITFDTFTGIILARQNGIISSKISLSGSTKKLTIIMFILLILAITSSITTFVQMENGASKIIGMIPHFFLLLFMLGEFISICENMSGIFSDKKSGKIFMVLNYLSEKLFNLTLDKLKEKTENKIEEKTKNI